MTGRVPTTTREVEIPLHLDRPVRTDRSVLTLNLAMAVMVWILWLALGRDLAISSMIHYWRISVTMIFGSFSGGATSEGGGGIAFPVLTKVLHISAACARLFTYAIQTVGMGTASLTILFLRVPIERRFLSLAAPAGVAGVILGATMIAPLVQATEIRVFFSVLMTSVAMAIIIQEVRGIHGRSQRISRFGVREEAIAVATGLAGGLLSGVIGIGVNMVGFVILVMLFRVSEKVATPTTVILMAIVSVTGFLTHILLIGDFTAVVPRYWLSAVPVVVVGAPFGALMCSKMSRRVINFILVGLIATDCVTTVLVVPMSRLLMMTAAVILAAGSVAIYLMTRVTRYRPSAEPVSGGPWIPSPARR